MIAIDTNVLVRFLVADNTQQAEAARVLLAGLTAERPGFICREVTIEIAWVLQRVYGFSRGRIATVLEELIATEELDVEAVDDLARAAFNYRRDGAGFSDLMIQAAAKRHGSYPLYTFDRQVALLAGAMLLEESGS